MCRKEGFSLSTGKASNDFHHFDILPEKLFNCKDFFSLWKYMWRVLCFQSVKQQSLLKLERLVTQVSCHYNDQRFVCLFCCSYCLFFFQLNRCLGFGFLPQPQQLWYHGILNTAEMNEVNSERETT